VKTEAEIWHELQKVRALRADYESAGVKGRGIDMLHGAEQALGWAIDRLRSPSDTEIAMRRHMHERKLMRTGVARNQQIEGGG
jgi:hypothetical protein